MEVRIPDATADGIPYIVAVAGDLDIATVDDLDGPMLGAIRGGRRPVILDLSHCEFIDSSGIRLLLRAHHQLRENGGARRRVLAVVAHDHVARLLRLMCVDKVLPIVPSRAEAEEALPGRAA